MFRQGVYLAEHPFSAERVRRSLPWIYGCCAFSNAVMALPISQVVWWTQAP